MTHEPECDRLIDQGWLDWCTCEFIRAAYTRGHQIGYRTGCEEQAGRDAYDRHDIERLAYQRGREDAAEGIRNFYFGQRWPDYANPDDIVHQLIAAARGDGEEVVVVSPAVERLSDFKPLWADTAYGRIYFDPAARGEACTCSCHPEAALCCLRCMKAHDIAAARGEGEQG